MNLRTTFTDELDFENLIPVHWLLSVDLIYHQRVCDISATVNRDKRWRHGHLLRRLQIRRIAYLHLLGEFIDILMHDLSVTKYAVTK